MSAIEAVRKFRSWHVLLGALAAAFILTTPVRALAGETGSVDEYAGTASLDAVVLDPFDPVPNIEFRHGWDGDRYRHCDRDGCGPYIGERCHEDCHWHGWVCPHDCYGVHPRGTGDYNLGWWRCANDCRDGDWWCDHDCHLEGWHCEHNCFIHEPCDHDCGIRPPFPRCDRRDCRMDGDRCADVCYGIMVRAYQEYNERLKRYDEQEHWYFEHVMDRRDFDHHGLFDRHDGPPPPPPPVGMTGPGPNGPPMGLGPNGPPGPPPGPGPGGATYGPGPSPDGPPPYGQPPPGPGPYGQSPYDPPPPPPPVGAPGPH